MQTHPADDLDLGASIAGFAITFVVGTITLGAIAIWWGVGGALLGGGCIAVLLLPFGLDTRLGGWLSALALPVALTAWSMRILCPPPNDNMVPLVMCDNIVPESVWWTTSLALLVGGVALALVARGRARRAT